MHRAETISAGAKGNEMAINLTVSENGAVRYRYRASEYLAFDFNMLCEVGEPYQAAFTAEIKRRGLVIECRELDQYPWVMDFVVNTQQKITCTTL